MSIRILLLAILASCGASVTARPEQTTLLEQGHRNLPNKIKLSQEEHVHTARHMSVESAVKEAIDYLSTNGTLNATANADRLALVVLVTDINEHGRSRFPPTSEHCQ